jgi:alkylation response protein AidB-like acyl-CoA dehydrogenase
MDFSLSKSQELLKNSAREFLSKECKESARESEGTSAGFSKKIWKKISELGWNAIGIDEKYGGVEGDFFDLVLLIEEMGRVLLPGPFIASAICSGATIIKYGSESQKSKILPQLCDGKIIIVPAIVKPADYAGEATLNESFYFENGYYYYTGTRMFVPYGHIADLFIGSAEDSKGNKLLFLADSKSNNIECNVLKTIASDKQCELIFNRLKIPRENIIGSGEEGHNILNKINEIGALAHCAYILGSIERILEMTVDYATNRVQFEKPIGSFQAIQHYCANMAIDVEQVKCLTYRAGWKVSAGISATKDIAMAKARASDAARRVSLNGVKVHGGIGIIEEYDMQLYFRNAKAGEIVFGDGDYHKEIVAHYLGL